MNLAPRKLDAGTFCESNRQLGDRHTNFHRDAYHHIKFHRDGDLFDEPQLPCWFISEKGTCFLQGGFPEVYKFVAGFTGR